MNIQVRFAALAVAFSGVSSAYAADAIVAAAPEPVEYVRVCDAFGKGYFYIPGTETCLKISGNVRVQLDWSSYNRGAGVKEFDWNSKSRGYLNFASAADSEIGPIKTGITILAWADSDGSTNNLNLDEAFFTVGGFRAGYGYNYWDAGLNSATPDLGSNQINQIGYEYTAGAIKAGLFVDELTKAYSRSAAAFNAGTYGTGGMGDNITNNVGVEGQVSGKFGSVNVSLLGGYDIAAEEGAVRLMGTADIGPGTFGAAVVYSSGVNAYYDKAEWTTAVEYTFKVTDKLAIAPGFQYWWNVNTNAAGDYTNGDAWKAGLTVDYKITDGFTAKASAQYSESDAAGVADSWKGYLRLQRTF